MTKTKTVTEPAAPTPGAPSETTTAYLAVIDAAAKDRGKEPAWLTSRRKEARALFEAHGIPHPKLEGFRTTNLQDLRKHAWPVPTSAGEVDRDAVAAQRIEGTVAFAVSVDGIPVPGLSTTELPGGAVLMPLSEALTAHADLLEGHLAKVVAHDGPEETLRALNTAAFRDGWFLHLPKGATLGGSVQVLHVMSARGDPVAVHPRLFIHAGETSEGAVVESFVGLGTTPYLVNSVTECVLAQSAVLDHVKIQSEPLGAYHTSAVGAHEGRDAKWRDLSVAIGAAVSRNDIIARIGEGAEVHMNGLFLAKLTQLVDHHTWIDHAQPHGTSLERYKGILDGKARGVFTGNVLVRPQAQKVNSEQENRNLILSREALIDTTPQLEIHADDVKCAHGSTIGQLPKDQLFYLRTRGLEEEEAKRVLTEAFAAEVLEDLAEGPLRTHVEDLIAAWFRTRKEDA